MPEDFKNYLEESIWRIHNSQYKNCHNPSNQTGTLQSFRQFCAAIHKQPFQSDHLTQTKVVAGPTVMIIVLDSQGEACNNCFYFYFYFLSGIKCALERDLGRREGDIQVNWLLSVGIYLWGNEILVGDFFFFFTIARYGIVNFTNLSAQGIPGFFLHHLSALFPFPPLKYSLHHALSKQAY